MQRIMLKSKIHRATVTDVNIEYEGSLTLDEEIMEKASLIPFEQIHVYNISNGKRFQTYVIKGKRGSGEVCINGAAAWLARKGDLIIIASYSIVTEEAGTFKPTLVYLDKDNVIKGIR
ncbi:MAG: aspartate 1-decarboxylase [Thermodesulfobacteriota bacterium]